MNKLFILNTVELNDKNIFEYCFNKMPEERKEKILNFHFEKDKKLSLGAGVLLYEGLKDFGVNSKEIMYNKNDKPYLKNNEIFFNISHSENIVICAFSDKEVGVDVEKINHFEKDVINRVFLENEINDSQNKDIFYTKLWTSKESLMKYLGTGLSLDPKAIQFDLKKNECISCDELNDKRFYFTQYEIEDYSVSVCSEYKSFTNELIWRNLR